MASLTRDQIIALRNALPTTVVDVPDFGAVKIRTLTLKEVSAFQRRRNELQGQPLRLYPELLRAACVDEAGNPLFVAADADVIDALSWPAADLLAREILRFNQMTPDDSPKD